MTGGWACPLPLSDHPRVTIAHGGGGRLTADLIDHLFTPAFADPATDDGIPADAAVLAPPPGRLAFTTDSYVVRPLEFPGGSIAELAVHGTVNDLAMAGARPLALSAAFVLEEGLEMSVLARIADRMGAAARAAGVRIVTGDTKVVDAGHGDGLYITTSGVGVVADGVDIRPERMTPGDLIVLSGPIGLHGTAVLSVREGIEFGTSVQSDTAPVHGIVADLIEAGVDVHTLRDLTRGGLGTALCELASGTGRGIEIDERAIPVPEEVDAACNLFGLDPLHVANEGRFVAMIAPDDAAVAVEVIGRHPAGDGATVIGRVTDAPAGVVVQVTGLGARRILEPPLGEQLPRIC